MKRLFAALAAVTLLAAPVHAADPVKVIVPFAAGGPVDALARILAAELAPRLQTDVVVENIGGAGGLLAVDRAMRSPPDGRTILFASVGAFVITNALKPQAGYDQLKSFAPVARIGAAPTLFIVKADSPIQSLADLIAKAKSDSKLSYGSAGNGTTMHIAAEQLNASAGTKITHVPYRGIAPALNDIMGGHINFLNGDITVLYPLVKQGTIRALAVAGNERSKLLPDVPTAARGRLQGRLHGELVRRAGAGRDTARRGRETRSRHHGRREESRRVGEDLRQRRLRPAGREDLPRADREGCRLLGRRGEEARHSGGVASFPASRGARAKRSCDASSADFTTLPRGLAAKTVRTRATRQRVTLTQTAPDHASPRNRARVRAARCRSD